MERVIQKESTGQRTEFDDCFNKNEGERTWVKLENDAIDNKAMELPTAQPKTTPHVTQKNKLHA